MAPTQLQSAEQLPEGGEEGAAGGGGGAMTDESCVYIEGLVIEGAEWDMEHGSLRSQREGSSSSWSKMPLVKVTPMVVDDCRIVGSSSTSWASPSSSASLRGHSHGCAFSQMGDAATAGDGDWSIEVPLYSSADRVTREGGIAVSVSLPIPLPTTSLGQPPSAWILQGLALLLYAPEEPLTDEGGSAAA
eukprot:GHVU01005890.1.p1 GENE.GHVU01005890.1~~GHVU01005890.1.p1  ORF type:complete len:215 (+),score=33.40 GHVU01005890.1:80-646(+)